MTTRNFCAAQAVMELLPYQDVRLGYGRNSGVLTTSNVEAFAAFAGLEVEFFSAHPLAFTDEDETFVAPWEVALRFARHLAPSVAEVILAEVAKEEEQVRKRAIYGDSIEIGKGL